jgi:catechol 2,3-dioxygenase
MAPGTVLGHVHLQVASIPAADAFYVGGIGFDPTVRGYPGALFVSAGGYHHHVGLNTWAGEGAPAPPPGARGLRSYTIVLPDEAALQRTLAAAGDSGIEPGEDEDGRTFVADPSGNRAVLTTR